MRGRVVAAAGAIALLLAACSSGGAGREVAPPGAPPPRAEAGTRAGAPPRYVDAHVPGATRTMATIESAIRAYAGDRAGRLPATLSDLVREKTPEGDPYLRSLPSDPWGRPFSYAVLVARFGRYDLRSYGPDGLPLTDDDVVARAEPVRIE